MAYMGSYIYWINESTEHVDVEVINQKVRSQRGQDFKVEDEFHTRPWTRWTYF